MKNGPWTRATPAPLSVSTLTSARAYANDYPSAYHIHFMSFRVRLSLIWGAALLKQNSAVHTQVSRQSSVSPLDALLAPSGCARRYMRPTLMPITTVQKTPTLNVIVSSISA